MDTRLKGYILSLLDDKRTDVMRQDDIDFRYWCELTDQYDKEILPSPPEPFDTWATQKELRWLDEAMKAIEGI